MITIWCSKNSTSAKLLVNKIKELGYEAQLVIGGRCPDQAVHWGCSSNKFEELRSLALAGLRTPMFDLSPRPGWLGRSFDHTQARDLRRGIGRDYWVEPLDIDKEYRFHIFDGKSIRRQFKEPRVPNPHPWIRNHKTGWKLSPGGDATDEMREAAVRAVTVLNRRFGAVDLGRLRSGGFVVLEVNSRPGIEGSTVTQYAKAIINWHQNNS